MNEKPNVLVLMSGKLGNFVTFEFLSLELWTFFASMLSIIAKDLSLISFFGDKERQREQNILKYFIKLQFFHRNHRKNCRLKLKNSFDVVRKNKNNFYVGFSLSIFFRSIQVFLLFLALTKLNAEDVNVECNFSVPAGTVNYLCEVSGIEFSGDNKSQNFIFSGTHLVARTNDHVTHVTIRNSQVPFVISQIFTTFRNLIHLSYLGGGLTSIQSNAVVDARNLEIFTARFNPELTKIHSNAFSGASNLVQLMMNNNSIHDVHEKAFVGLQRTRVINLSNNQIRELPENVFRPARRLQTLFFRNNQIDTLYASMFAHNNIMHQIELHDNRINAIDRNFFVSIRNLTWLMLLRNVCANRTFVFGMTDDAIIEEGLAPCFDNFDRITRSSLKDEI